MSHMGVLLPQGGKMAIHIVITAAGTGERFGGNLPKQYAILAGKPVLQHAVECFSGIASVATIITVHPSHSLYYEKLLKSKLPRSTVVGAETRQKSVYSALKSLSAKEDDIVLIHDGARPNVSLHDIHNLVAVMHESEAASLALPVSDTLRRADDIIDRNNLWALQTPQAFRFGTLKKAHETVKGEFTDDTGLVSAMGVAVKIVPGSKTNIKITTREDFDMLEKLMTQGEIRSGTGFDVHAFSHEKGRKLMLCGVEIDHPFGLAGHSDADVGLHAITDALLGAIGEGDIGLHFPPSDSAFKNMDSRIFLEKSAAILANKAGLIQNVDVTIICESPKISLYRDAMRNKIAQILKIDSGRVNVKGTTTEGLGFTGRGEGIAAQAAVTVRL